MKLDPEPGGKVITDLLDPDPKLDLQHWCSRASWVTFNLPLFEINTAFN
jgi:hypothetical protein